MLQSLKSIIGKRKDPVVNAFKRYPDRYYGIIYLNEPLFKGIAEVAKIEGISKKKAAQLIIELGFSSYMGEGELVITSREKRIRIHLT